MANRLKMEHRQLIFALLSQNWSIRKISKSIGIHRETITRYQREWLQNEQVNKYPENTNQGNIYNTGQSGESIPLSENQVPPEGVVHFQVPTDPTNTADSKSKASVYHDKIHEKLRNGQQARSIYQDLVIEDAFDGSYDSVKRYVRKIKASHPKLYARIEMPPGEEAQVDFGEGAPTLKDGKYKKPWLFIMTLSCSRKSYEECVWTQDVETFIRCHENAFRFFGGVTRMVKIDNLKSAVLKAHLYEPELNPNYQAFAEHYGFIPMPCRVRTPEHKGKVESSVDYTQNNALKGKAFESLDKQNQYLRAWNRTWASTRIHGTTKRQVNRMFDEERPFLQKLPETEHAFFKIGTRKVSSADSHIEVQGAYYPIPPKYMGKQVDVHFNSRWVKAFYQGVLIQHLSTIDKGRFHPNRACLPPEKNFTQAGYVRYLKDRCLILGPDVLKWAELAEEIRQDRAYRSIQGILALSKKYPAWILNAACRKSIDQYVFNYHIVKNQAEEIRLQKQIQQEITFTQESELIRPPKVYQDLISGGDNG